MMIPSMMREVRAPRPADSWWLRPMTRPQFMFEARQQSRNSARRLLEQQLAARGKDTEQ